MATLPEGPGPVKPRQNRCNRPVTWVCLTRERGSRVRTQIQQQDGERVPRAQKGHGRQTRAHVTEERVIARVRRAGAWWMGEGMIEIRRLLLRDGRVVQRVVQVRTPAKVSGQGRISTSSI